MALFRSSPLIILYAALGLGCTDSELDGAQPFRHSDARPPDGVTDIAGDVVEDVADTADTADAPDVPGCTSNEQCRGALGGLGPCDEPICDPNTLTCRAERRRDCCASDADCPAFGDPCLENRCPVPGASCVALDVCIGCQSDAECASGDPCLAGRCGAGGACFYDPIPGCGGCERNEQCADGQRCTADRCVGGECVHEPLPNCCAEDAACDDGDPCTIDVCRNNGSCVSEPIPGCGACTQESCDDGDPCTEDTCTDAGCVHVIDELNPECWRCRADSQCDDGDPCEIERCLDGRCLSETALNPDGSPVCACGGPADCDDGEACTRDVCEAGLCANLFDPGAPGCGCGGSTCDDFDPCTRDFCDGLTCQHVFTPELPECGGRCQNDFDCPPADMCTKSFCDVQLGACVVVSAPDCCTSVAECDDGDRCTEDACLADGRCFHQAIPGCDACGGCDDNDPCTIDGCDASGRCSHETIPGCDPGTCMSDSDCADATECTNNFCIGGDCVTAAVPGCCRRTADCNDGSDCTEDFCLQQSGICVNAPRDCDDDNPCTIDRCDADLGCVSVPDAQNPECRCEPDTLWKRSFIPGETPDIDTDGSGFGIRWRVDSLRSFSPSQSLRFGDDEGQDYANGFRTFGRATGPELEVPFNVAEVRLDFMVYMDIDADPQRDSLRARVLYRGQNDIVWDRVSVSPERFQQWIPVSVALPAEVIGETIEIRFVFDSLDGEGNLGLGVFVDDIAVYTTCP